MSLRATARRQNGTVSNLVEVAGHTIVTDEPEAWGGDGKGPSPQELLAASFASCTATTIAMYARYREWELDDLEVDVEYYSHSHPKRFTVTVRLPAGLPEERRERLMRASSVCAVRQTLEGEVEIDERFEVAD